MEKEKFKVLANVKMSAGEPMYYVVSENNISDKAVDGYNCDYTLQNVDLDCYDKFLKDIRETFDLADDEIEIVVVDEESVNIKIWCRMTDEEIWEIEKYAAWLRKEMEIHYNSLYYNNFDGKYWNSYLLQTDNKYFEDEIYYVIKEDDKQIMAAFMRGKEKGKKNYHDDATGYKIVYNTNFGLAEVYK